MFRNEYIYFSEPKLYSCSFCQKPSDTAWDLVQHVQTSHGRFSFHSCQAIFPDYKVNISGLSLYSPQCKYSPRNHSRSLCYCPKVFKSALRERRKPTWPLPLSGVAPVSRWRAKEQPRRPPSHQHLFLAFFRPLVFSAHTATRCQECSVSISRGQFYHSNQPIILSQIKVTLYQG